MIIKYFLFVFKIKFSKLEKDKYSWLKKYDFYENLDLDGGSFKIIYCSKYTKNINLFLDVAAIWEVSYYPIEFFKLLLDTKPLEKLETLYSNTNYQNNIYKFFIQILKTNRKKLSYISIEWDRIDALSYFIKSEEDLSLYAIKYNKPKCLEYLLKNSIENDIYSLLKLAASSGSIECLKVMSKNIINSDIINDADKWGRFKCIKYIYMN